MEGHQNVKGDNHPSKRAYRQEYRPIPERMRLAVRNWRARIKDTLRELGKPATLEIWRGPSRFDGQPIVVLAARVRASSSVNPKTNDMVQIYILPQADPAQSLQDEADLDPVLVARATAHGLRHDVFPIGHDPQSGRPCEDGPCASPWSGCAGKPT